MTPADVVSSYSGVRPLLEDASSDPSGVSRDYKFELDFDGPPLLSVFGGKITTYRRLAEEALGHLLPVLGASGAPWTHAATLPGGDMPGRDFEAFRAEQGRLYPRMPAPLLDRWTRAYGTRLSRVLGDAQTEFELGEAVLPGLYAAEIDYLRRVEWARSAEDILWRRSKLGLHLPASAGGTLDAWLARQPRPA